MPQSADLGRLLGLDRAPEVKTLRRKLTELASHQRGAALQMALAGAHAESRPDALGFLHVDGHSRVYSGGFFGFAANVTPSKSSARLARRRPSD